MSRDAWDSLREVDLVLAQLADDQAEVVRLLLDMTDDQRTEFAQLLLCLTGNLGMVITRIRNGELKATR